MRSALVALLLLAALHPMMTVAPVLDEENPLLAAGHGVEVIEEVERLEAMLSSLDME